MSVENQVNVKSQSELDIGGRETCKLVISHGYDSVVSKSKRQGRAGQVAIILNDFTSPCSQTPLPPAEANALPLVHISPPDSQLERGTHQTRDTHCLAKIRELQLT